MEEVNIDNPKSVIEKHEQENSLSKYYHSADNEQIIAYNLYHEFRSEKDLCEDYQLKYFSDYYHEVYDTITDAAQDVYNADYEYLPCTMKEGIDWDIVADELGNGADDAYTVYWAYVPGFGDKIFVFHNG